MREWLLVAAACGSSSAPAAEQPPVKHDAAIAIDAAVVGPLPPVPAGLPAQPDLGITAAQVAAGAHVFQANCARCHDSDHNFSGGMDKTFDGQPNLRRTPALVNLAWQHEFGWDGRYPSVADLLPAHERGQLGNPLPADDNKALTAYVLTRYEGNAPWDRMEATATKASKDPVVAGYALFTGKVQCAVCHPPPLYTDLGYHKIVRGVYADEGRGKVDPNAVGAFKTPSLRGAAKRAAFFHDGSATTLEAAIEAHGFHLPPNERDQINAFVRALTETK
jgi:cytochrome c peroxidase